MRIPIITLICLAAIGLVLSSGMYVCGLLGLFGLVLPQESEPLLFDNVAVGSFVIVFLAAFIAHYFIGFFGSKNCWAPILRECPRWMRGLISGVGAFAVVNFIVEGVLQSFLWPGQGSQSLRFRIGAGHFMFFYCAGLCMLYAVLIVHNRRQARRCNGGNV